MTKNQATKRPWTVQINSHSHYLGSYQIWDRDGNSLTDSDKEDEEIRSYVEKAVNCHDELVEALKLIINDIEENHLNTYTRSDFLGKAKQALLMAESEA